MLALAAQFTQRFYQWTAWKVVQSSKNLITQWDDDGTVYTIYGYDNPEVHLCNIWKGAVPPGVLSVYSQAQNDSDKADFETNVKPLPQLRISRTDKFGNAITLGFEAALAFGQIPGATSGLAAGYVGTSATSSVVVRATAYTAQGANALRSVKSSSALDTAAGTGAQTILTTYLTTTFTSYLTETITLNGTTAVNSVGQWAFLEEQNVATAGTLGGNQGTLSSFTTTAGGGSVWGSIAAGDNKTYWAHHYVPSGVTCYITNITAMATVAPGQVTLQTQGNPNSTTTVQLAVGSTYGHGNEQASGLVSTTVVGVAQLEHAFRFPLAIAGPNFIFMNERPIVATASTAYGSFEYVQF